MADVLTLGTATLAVGAAKVAVKQGVKAVAKSTFKTVSKNVDQIVKSADDLARKGITTANGLKIDKFAGHAVNRAIGSTGRKAVSPNAILDALKNPLKINDVVTDNLGRKSQRFIGRFSETVVNPEIGKIISVNPTSTKKAARLLRRINE